jgi:4-hydroxybenzoate polyprenyltransferase
VNALEWSASPRPARLLSLAFWRGYWVTSRPYLFFVSGASGLVGLALVDMPASRLWPAAVAFFLSYGLGQALTDVFQTDTDALSAPYRPLVQGTIAPGHVLAVSLVGLLACGLVFGALNLWTLPLTLLAVVGLFTYTPFKRRFWGGPPWNSAIVGLLPVIGLLCGGGSVARAFGQPGLGPAVASVFFSYAIFVLLGYFKDVEADRRTGYQTLPVRFGRRLSVVVSGFFLAAAAFGSVALVRGVGMTLSGADPRRLVGLVLWLTGLALLILAHVRILPTRRDEEAHGPIALSVRGFVALHFGEAVLLQVMLAAPVIVLYILFEISLATRPEVKQV